MFSHSLNILNHMSHIERRIIGNNSKWKNNNNFFKRLFNSSSESNLYSNYNTNTNTNTNNIKYKYGITAALVSAITSYYTMNIIESNNNNNSSFSSSSTSTSSNIASSSSDIIRPHKFHNFHRECNSVIEIQTFNGAKIALQVQAFPTRHNININQNDEDNNTTTNNNIAIIDKQFTFAPMIQSNTEGTEAMFNLVTELGHNHQLEGLFNTQGIVVGSYKYKSNKWSLKPSFQFVPNNENIQLEFDYKGSNFLTGLNFVLTSAAVSAHYSQAVNKNISAGVELDYALAQHVKLNYTGL